MTMDLCLDGRLYPQPHTRHQQTKEYKMQWSYKPFVTQRPRTSYSVRDAFSPSPRIHSATPLISMTATPRTQVSMAGFYDWSTTEDKEDNSASTIYRKIASLSQKGKFGKGGNKSWCADGVHVSPGRMFLRDKAELTKGEREIIAGIYKNRSDTSKDNKHTTVGQIKSHRDAWLVGKKISKRTPQINYQEDTYFKVPEHLFSKMEAPKLSNSTICYMCAKCRDDCCYHGQDREEEKYDTDDEDDIIIKPLETGGRKAPPSTPSSSPTSSRRQNKPSKSNVSEGAIFIESGKTFYDPEEKSRKKKVFVDVFLPKFPTPSLNEEVTGLEINNDSDCNKSETNGSEKLRQTRLDKKQRTIQEEEAEKDISSGTRIPQSRQTKGGSCSSSRAASSSGE